MNIQKYFKDNILEIEEIKGHFNKNFKVKTKKGLFHLKVFRNDSFELKEWINGKTIKTWTEKNIMLVCNELMFLHKQTKNWDKMDYKKDKIKDLKYVTLLKKYKDEKWVSCHNDLNKDNVVINENKAFLIDFEFKRINNKYWEIANIFNEDSLNKRHFKLFLKYYKGLEKEKLNDFIYINKIFIKYWSEKFAKRLKQK